MNAAISEGHCTYAFSRAKQPSIEATAWSAIALMRSHPALENVVAFLLKSQNEDGGWPTTPGEQSNWTTAPALLALRLIKHHLPGVVAGTTIDRSIQNGIQFLIERRTDPQVPVLRFLLLYMHGKAGLDGAGKGWAWTGNLYHWVEPTVYSLLALKLPNPVDNKLIKQTIQNGNKYLLSHTCKGGGWNHGQFFCLGEDLPPYTLTTSEALIALLDVPENTKIQQGLNYLTSFKYEALSAWSLAWTVLALHAYGLEHAHILDSLLNLQDKSGSFGSNYLSTAFSILALDTANGINIFSGRYNNNDLRKR